MLDFIKDNNVFRVSEQEEVSVSATEGMAVSRELEGMAEGRGTVHGGHRFLGAQLVPSGF